MVSKELQQRVNERLAEVRTKCEKAFGRTFKPAQHVDYKLRGRVAGMCYYTEGRLSFNADLMIRNEEDFINQTVAHELAHYIHYQMHPEDLIVDRGQKRDAHGYNWKRVMVAMGVDPKRCHNYDTAETKVRNKRTEMVKCIRCGKEFGVTPLVLNRIVAGAMYTHKRCGGFLNAVADVQTPKVVFGGVPIKPTVTTQLGTLSIHHTGLDPKVSTTGRSKMDICRDLYRTMNGTKSRQEIIAAFVSKAGCTPAGANTYYATLKAGK